jgi:periplasmic protein TonB
MEGELKVQVMAVLLLGSVASGACISQPGDGSGTAGKPSQAQPADHEEKQPPTIPMKEAKEHVVTRVDAPYPPIANMAHVSGVVTIGVEVDSEGNVTKVVPINGPAMLTNAAADAVKQYKFRPFEIDGKPAVVRTGVQVKFVLGHSKSSE